MAYSKDQIVYKIERKYDVQAIESKAKDLWYLQDEERKQIGIMTVKNGIPKWEIFDKEQFKAFANLLKRLKRSQVIALGMVSAD